MERSASDPLQCPRCNSSNTKFCYYNNYNLSQPRHFCKACKRYWTRGGTLRNVPVGGGCRKNKKFKRHPPSNGDEFAAIMKPSSLQPNVDLSPPSSNHINNNPFFSSFPTELNFPFSVARVSSDSPRFDDLLPRIVGPGLGFSPDYRNPVFDQTAQDHASCITFGSSSFSPNSTMASLLAQHQRFAASSEFPFPFPSLTPYDGMHMAVGNGEIGKEPEIRSNQIHEPFLWNSNNVGVWFDPSSSVPSLI